MATESNNRTSTQEKLAFQEPSHDAIVVDNMFLELQADLDSLICAESTKLDTESLYKKGVFPDDSAVTDEHSLESLREPSQSHQMQESVVLAETNRMLNYILSSAQRRVMGNEGC